jgi:lipid-A-disaccharide synthase
VAEAYELLLCLFDFEPACYAPYAQTRALWVGHPLLDRLPPRGEVEPEHWGLLPGSRPQERERLLPIYLEVADLLQVERGWHFTLVVPPEASLPALPPHVRRAGQIQDLSRCRGALTKSGTVTLELAVMGLPMLVAHAVHPLTWALGTLLVDGVDHIALPNILAGRPVVPEQLQRLDPSLLAALLVDLPTRQATDLRALGTPGAADRAAQALLQHLEAP